MKRKKRNKVDCSHRKTYTLKKYLRNYPHGKKSGFVHGELVKCTEKCGRCKKTLYKWRPER